ncbi:MAG: hypothetical protein MUF81_07300, partial [Verrucomicrobia bacterium]|nr:hypothetical protein [Verrucomicrobiota bacterium]
MATLDFKGKALVQNYHLTVKYHELVPKKDKSLTSKVCLDDNLIIHGDNLKALKALLPTCAGKVKCIYIDVPYNTGNVGWIYNDNVNSPMMQEWFGTTVDRDDLTKDCGISADEVAVKSSDKDDIEGLNLFARNCAVRYIITKQALQEGWDCSFAYVLTILTNPASKNGSSLFSVEPQYWGNRSFPATMSKLFRNVLLLTHERMSSCWFVVCGSVPPAGGA